MPGIQAGIKENQPGSGIYEQYINEFLERRTKGEPAQSITQDILGRLQSQASQQPQYPDASKQVPSVGMNQGVPALGQPGGLQQPISQPPNSFAQPQPQSPIANAAGGTMPVNTGIAATAAAANANALNTTPQQPPPMGTMQPDAQHTNQLTEQPVTQGVVPNQAPHVPQHPPELSLIKQPIPNRQAPSVAPSGTSPMPRMRTRGEQERMMGEIERVKALEDSTTKIGNAMLNKDQTLQYKILKQMMDTNRLTAKDIANLRLKVAGKTAEEQMFIVEQFIKQQMNREDNDAANYRARLYAGTRERIAADKGADKMPSRLKAAQDNYFRTLAEAEKLRQGMNVDMNQDEIRKLDLKIDYARNAFNALAKVYDYPEINAGVTEGPIQMPP